MTDTAVAVDDKEPEADEETTSEGPRRYLIPALIAGLVVALCLAGTFFFLWLQTADPKAEDVGTFIGEQKPGVEQKAIQVVNLLLNYDATTIGEVAEQMAALSTGNFKDDYQNLIIEQGLKDALEEAKASSRGQILEGPDIYFGSGSEAVAVANVTQTTQNKDNPTGQTVNYVIRLSFVNTADGGWKADSVDLLTAG